MTFECDRELLKNRARWFKWVHYGFLLCFILVYYFYPLNFFVDENFLGVGVFLLIWRALAMMQEHYEGALLHHGSEVLNINECHIEYCNNRSGYCFKKKNEDVVSVAYTRFLGKPNVKILFINNKFYTFSWFKYSEDIYFLLKSKEV